MNSLWLVFLIATCMIAVTLVSARISLASMRTVLGRRLGVAAAIPGLLVLLALPGCQETKNADGTTTVTTNISYLNQNGQAIIVGLQTLEKVPAISALLTKDLNTKTQIDSWITKIGTALSGVNDATSGTLSVTTGKDVAQDVITYTNEALTILLPIVQQVYPQAVTYVKTIQSLLPIIGSLFGIDVTTPAALSPLDAVPLPLGARLGVDGDNGAAARAAILKGLGA